MRYVRSSTSRGRPIGFIRIACRLEVDDDGDLVVPTAAVAEAAVKQRERFAVVVGHTRESTLASVGLQVWRGALLLCDFMIGRHWLVG